MRGALVGVAARDSRRSITLRSSIVVAIHERDPRAATSACGGRSPQDRPRAARHHLPHAPEDLTEDRHRDQHQPGALPPHWHLGLGQARASRERCQGCRDACSARPSEIGPAIWSRGTVALLVRQRSRWVAGIPQMGTSGWSRRLGMVVKVLQTPCVQPP